MFSWPSIIMYEHEQNPHMKVYINGVTVQQSRGASPQRYHEKHLQPHPYKICRQIHNSNWFNSYTSLVCIVSNDSCWMGFSASDMPLLAFLLMRSPRTNYNPKDPKAQKRNGGRTLNVAKLVRHPLLGRRLLSTLFSEKVAKSR
jgi:hypothetical protein